MPRLCDTGCGATAVVQQHTLCHRCRAWQRRHGNLNVPPVKRAYTRRPYTVDEDDISIIADRRERTPGLHRLEKRAVARRLTTSADPVHPRDIARIVCASERQVWRWLADDRQAGQKAGAAA